MALSMTGFGDARLQDERWTVQVEVRSVNNRHLKLTSRISEPYSSLEPEFEKLIREKVKRGTVQLHCRVDKPLKPEDYRLNLTAIQGYRDQLAKLGAEVDWTAILSLPGVVEDRREQGKAPSDDWPLLQAVVTEALEKFQASRTVEGRAMAEELQSLSQQIRGWLEGVETRVPEVVSGYRDRLLERVEALVRDHGIAIEPKDLIREVSVFAERADVAEEITRLKAHLVQFEQALKGEESPGRRLEFIVQEMGRETNTIGSKASDVEISRGVIEIKGALEKIRELIQNIE